MINFSLFSALRCINKGQLHEAPINAGSRAELNRIGFILHSLKKSFRQFEPMTTEIMRQQFYCCARLPFIDLYK